MATKVNIIGAGIAGLSAGCYLQMNGYDTQIFELHSISGGLCTSWKRKEYIFDGCIHWLVGSNPRENLYRLWNELVDMEKLEFIDFDEYIRVEDKEGKTIRVFCDVDRLEEEMLAAAPEDEELIVDFARAVRKLSKFEMPFEKAPQVYNIFDAAKMMLRLIPYMGTFRKWGRMTGRQVADKCRNPLLKKVFESLFLPEMMALFSAFTLARMHKKSAGYPVGGSLEFARLIEQRYLELGGKINYKLKVEKIVTEDGAARGIVLATGETHNSDIVISAADGHCTIFEMLDGKYMSEKIRNYYENYTMFPSYVQVSLGVARTFEDEPHLLIFPAEKAIRIDDSSEHEYFGVRIFNFDATAAPEGKTVMTMMFPTANYKYWEDLRNGDAEKYKSEKDRIAKDIIEALDKRFGDIKSNVEVIDVSTPATVIRYTNNWKGSFEGWVLTPEIGMKQMEKTLPGLDNFYMAGQWVEPGGGVPTALMSGRNITQVICKKDGKKFVTIEH